MRNTPVTSRSVFISGNVRREKEMTEAEKNREAAECGKQPQTAEDEWERRRGLILDVMGEKAYVPMKLKELAALLNIPREQRGELKRVVASLLEEGKIAASRRGRLGLPEAFSVNGTFTGHPRGYGFVTVPGRETDLFIPADQTAGAMHGDRVLAVIEKEDGNRAEGRILRILEHANREIVGLYEKSRGFGFVIPDNPRIGRDIFVPEGCGGGAVTGSKVVVTIRDYGGETKKPEGVITEVLGHVHDPGVDILSIVRAYDLPEEFSPEAKAEAAAIPDRLTQADLAGRRDLRDLLTVTIDGEDARDLDDAVTLVQTDRGWRLGVHIADVSHYVTENSALDREALRRGTSVYLTDRVIPMLPRRLSNGICSLNPGEDRLALSCLMEIDEKGTVTDHEIVETVIRSDRRMAYAQVNAVLTGEETQAEETYGGLADLFRKMDELAKLLRARRKSRGAVDFDFAECRILLDGQGRPTGIVPHERNAATRLIEDFMLAANETVAEDYFWQGLPFVYRTHENPDGEKMAKLAAFLGGFGYTLHLADGKPRPGALQKILSQAEGRPEEAMLCRVVLRSMKQAKYTVQNTGHFGLAASYYTHFTSPIRRYPDLQIHRIIKENLHGGLSARRIAHYERILPEVAAQASALERRADEAERETEKLKKTEYMEAFIGQSFDGVISGVTGWGFYVELPDTVEGLVPVGELKDDYYRFDAARYELVGEMTGRTWRLGQPVRVTLTGCDRYTRTIDFVPAGTGRY